eukprot:1158500-Pelagomonas_calceolata.AAC.2
MFRKGKCTRAHTHSSRSCKVNGITTPASMLLTSAMKLPPPQSGSCGSAACRLPPSQLHPSPPVEDQDERQDERHNTRQSIRGYAKAGVAFWSATTGIICGGAACRLPPSQLHPYHLQYTSWHCVLNPIQA